jgi:hypothetical protein
MAPLKNTGNMELLYRALSTANAATVMVYDPESAIRVDTKFLKPSDYS